MKKDEFCHFQIESEITGQLQNPNVQCSTPILPTFQLSLALTIHNYVFTWYGYNIPENQALPIYYID